ncbi:Zn-dependent peptidase ImmA (M78 family) [Halanaerobium saccharolyticum]|uniref:Zn-dependent peptidase ImmA (M78 family) n=1 Tax=Halanaerobium saccharolyticum TaxID=43595 RepID=A0A2T5RFC4_9FIRM|nr:XRE family transcriptional regulator [Halanaerobium saccharolyticum]PTV93036.1 Zn-dependent peptidase ImmA (M78 family) [Halanaerobium saccharolyticum]
MKVAEVIAKNLKELQDEFNLNQTEMGEIIGVTRQTFAKYLDGERVMDSGKLYKLARYFDKEIDFFLSEKSKRGKVSFMFRADDPENDFDDKLKNKIADKFKLYHEIIELSDDPVKDYLPEEYKLEIKGDKLNKKEKAAIEKIAEKQRRYMGVDDALNINVFTLFEENNINVIAQEIKDANLDAVSAYSEDKGAYIFINDSRDIPEERKIFSAVHELGHLILHRDQYSKDINELKYANTRIKNIREKAADHFAMAFLVPAKVLKNYDYYFDGYIDLDLIIEKKKDFGVSAKSLIMTLNKYGYIDGRILGALFKKLKEAGFDKKEPEPRDYIRKNEKLFALVRKLVIKEEITINKAAEVLNIPVLEMRKLAKKWKNYEYRTA